MTLAPSISQITTCPVRLLYQMMSALPSPLTSPVPGTNHVLIGGSEPGEPPPMTFGPFISQTTTWPVVLLCQRMSPLPSPSKSPLPAHARPRHPHRPPRPPFPPAPSSTKPPPGRVFALRKRFSPPPSPWRARGPTPPQAPGADPGDPPPMTFGPFISQTTTWPEGPLR